MEICRLENIEKIYESDEKVTPIKQLSLTINSGDFISIEGPSGVGKSTLLYIIGGLLDVSSGKVFIAGEDLTSMSDKELTNIRKDKIGFIFQDNNLIQALSIEENLLFAQSVSNKQEKTYEVEELLTRLGLLDRKNFLPNELSGGQRRRAMIACTLIKDPLLILADEPTNDLDDYWANEVFKLLSEAIKDGKGVVLVTHNTHWAKRAPLRFTLNEGLLHEKSRT